MTALNNKPRQPFTGYWGQKRLSAALPWRWDRQGQHAIVGFIVTMAAFLAALVMPPVLVGLWYLALTYAFIQYEVTETENVNDWAWPDIYGWMIGAAVALAPGALAWWLL